jgi:hypothetical protein
MTSTHAPSPPPAGPPPLPSADRLRLAVAQRSESDYIFEPWSALGWSILTLGVFWLYVFYQLMRRMRDHNRRRLELLDAASAMAWEQAAARGVQEELRPNFERLAADLVPLRQMTADFRDPVVWTVLQVLTGVAQFIAAIFLDQDLIKHDSAEARAEHELSAIYARLGVQLLGPRPEAPKAPHNYVGRIVATIFTFGIYGVWWFFDLMKEGNRHFELNWAWEDALVAGVSA